MATTHRPSIIFVTQVIDPGDAVLGFVPKWLDALAEVCDELAVVANEVRSVPAGANYEVHSLGKESGRARPWRFAEYQRILWRLQRRRRWDALVAHMCPIYLTTAIPATRWQGVPAYLWYAHPANTANLRLATRLSTAILTSLPGAFPATHHDIRVIGQATDVTATPRRWTRDASRPLRFVALGRTSPAKGYGALVRGFDRAHARRLRATLDIVGPSISAQEQQTRADLVEQIERSGMNSLVTLVGPVAAAAVSDVLDGADFLVNTTDDGSGDKVVFEAIAAGRLPLVSNRSFAGLLAGHDLMFDRDDPESLADSLLRASALSEAEYNAISEDLLRRVVSEHSLASWAGGVAQIASRGPTRHTRGAGVR